MPAILPVLYWAGAAIMAAYASGCASGPKEGALQNSKDNPPSKPLDPNQYKLRSITTFEDGTLIELDFYDSQGPKFSKHAPSGEPKNVSFFDQNNNQQLDENDLRITNYDSEVPDEARNGAVKLFKGNQPGEGAVRCVTQEDIRSFGKSSTSVFKLGYDHRQEMYNLIQGERNGSCAYIKNENSFSSLVGVKFDPPLTLRTRQVGPDQQYSKQEMIFRERQGLTYDPAKCAKASESISMDSVLGSPLHRHRSSIMIQIGNRHLNLPLGNPLDLTNEAGLDVYYSLEGENSNARVVHLDL